MGRGPILERQLSLPFLPPGCPRGSVSGISPSFPGLSRSQGQVTHALLTRPPLNLPRHEALTGPLDLHVLGTPPAFVLSQDQTLQLKPIKLTFPSRESPTVHFSRFSPFSQYFYIANSFSFVNPSFLFPPTYRRRLSIYHVSKNGSTPINPNKSQLCRNILKNLRNFCTKLFFTQFFN